MKNPRWWNRLFIFFLGETFYRDFESDKGDLKIASKISEGIDEKLELLGKDGGA
jgi:hypothetical protein